MKNIRFLGDGGDGCGSKRKQVRRACDSCRRRKRRCVHDLGSDAQKEGASQNPIITADLPGSRHNTRPLYHQLQESLESRERNEQNQHSSSSISTPHSTVPFAGPSSAHSLLISACKAPNMVAPGIDLDAARRLPYARILRPSFQDMRAPPSERRPGVGPGYLPMVVRAVLPYLEIECFQMLPPRRDYEALIQIFKEEIHPIMPIVDFNTQALTEPANGDNPASIIMRQAICLATAQNGIVMDTLLPGIKLLFFLSKMLDQVLGLYRAQPSDEIVKESCVWEASWPEFEDLARDCRIQTMKPPLQACLELLYHVIGVVSYRPPQSPVEHYPKAAPDSKLPPAIQCAKVRHKYCAQKITFLLSLGTSRLPFIPYAASLSLTVALRNMSQATLESTKTMAKGDVERSLGVLEGLAETYWHAESAGTIGRQIFQSFA